MSTLKNQASIKGHERKFAMGNESVIGFRTIYAFVQCTPDLSRRRCERCLEEAFGDIASHNGSIGGRVITPTCNFRYEVYNFLGRSYNATPTARLQSTIRYSSQPSSNKGTQDPFTFCFEVLSWYAMSKMGMLDYLKNIFLSGTRWKFGNIFRYNVTAFDGLMFMRHKILFRLTVFIAFDQIH